MAVHQLSNRANVLVDTHTHACTHAHAARTHTRAHTRMVTRTHNTRTHTRACPHKLTHVRMPLCIVSAPSVKSLNQKVFFQIWVVGGGSLLYRWAGSNWQLMPGSNVLRVHVNSPTEIVCVTHDNSLWKWTGMVTKKNHENGKGG